MCFTRPRAPSRSGAQSHSTCSKRHPKQPRGGSKTARGPPKSSPGAAQRSPRARQEAPGAAQEPPNVSFRAVFATKRGPHGVQEPSGRLHEAISGPPRGDFPPSGGHFAHAFPPSGKHFQNDPVGKACASMRPASLDVLCSFGMWISAATDRGSYY